MKATHAITTESDVRYETIRSATRYENEVENDAPHEIQSESDSRYRSRANGFQNIRKDGDRNLGHAQRRKPEAAQKKQVYMPSRGMNA